MQSYQPFKNEKDKLAAIDPFLSSLGHDFQDYEDFDMANELDELEKFLNVSQDNYKITENGLKNGSKIVSTCHREWLNFLFYLPEYIQSGVMC